MGCSTLCNHRQTPSAATARRLIIFSSCFVETPPARCAAGRGRPQPMIIAPTKVVAGRAEEKFNKQDSLHSPCILHPAAVDVVVSTKQACSLADLTTLPAASANSAFLLSVKVSLSLSLSPLDPPINAALINERAAAVVSFRRRR